MSDPFVENLNENTDPQPGDWLHTVEGAAAANDKDRKLNISRLAILAAANTFANANRFDGLVGLNIATSSTAQLLALSGATNRAAIIARAAASATSAVLEVQSNAGATAFAVFTLAAYDEQNLGNRYRVLTFPNFAVTNGSTLQIDVTSTLANRRSFTATFDANIAVGGGSNDRALLLSSVKFQLPQTAGSNASIRGTSEQINSTSNATITGPTAITNGIRYTLLNSAGFSMGSTQNSLVMILSGRSASALTVTATVV